MNLRRSAFVLIAIMSVLAWWFYARASQRYRQVLTTDNDVFAALSCYVEKYGGVMPGAEDDLVKARIVFKDSNGAFVVNRHLECESAGKVYGVTIPDIAAYEVFWGLDLTTLEIENDKVVCRNGNEVLILRSPSGLQASRGFSVALTRFVNQRVHGSRGN